MAGVFLKSYKPLLDHIYIYVCMIFFKKQICLDKAEQPFFPPTAHFLCQSVVFSRPRILAFGFQGVTPSPSASRPYPSSVWGPPTSLPASCCSSVSWRGLGPGSRSVRCLGFVWGTCSGARSLLVTGCPSSAPRSQVVGIVSPKGTPSTLRKNLGGVWQASVCMVDC